jgi:hypothetical protein
VVHFGQRPSTLRDFLAGLASVFLLLLPIYGQEKTLPFYKSKSVIVIWYCLQQKDVLLPEHCSAKVDGQECQLAPSYIVSVKSNEGDEYMLAVVCENHKGGIEARLLAMQKESKVPQGKIHFQPVKAVVTDCVMGMNEDYIELELKRGVESDRKLG